MKLQHGKAWWFFLAIICICNISLSVAHGADLKDDVAERKFSQGYAKMLGKAREKGGIRVIVKVDLDYFKDGEFSEDQLEEYRAHIAYKQRQLLNEHSLVNVRNVRLMSISPYIIMTVTASELEALKSVPGAISVEEDTVTTPMLLESLPGIGGSISGDFIYQNNSYTGNGQTVVVLDTPIQSYHEFLRGKLSSEACFSSNDGSRESLCPGGALSALGPGAASEIVRCESFALETYACGHGSLVSGIAAGKSDDIDVGEPRTGVAANAALVHINVSHVQTDHVACGIVNPVYGAPHDCLQSFVGDQLDALNYILGKISSSAGNGIWGHVAAINMSLGSDELYTGNCDSGYTAIYDLIASLRKKGVATIASTGNEGSSNSMSYPACLSNVISVAAADSYAGIYSELASLSNLNGGTDLVAPGVLIRSSMDWWFDPDSAWFGQGYAEASGTSFAAPHVAGAWAVLRSAKPSATVSEVLSVLKSTGVLLGRDGTSITKPMIKIDKAIQALMTAGSGGGSGGSGGSTAAQVTASVVIPATYLLLN
ncbi:MAG: S8 family serine peptidase [Gammaproteobacteria bacterium]|nr:S8 family serine peptidase [Gammaproteobacteria bacterium]